MRPHAGGGIELKHAPPMRVNDLPVVAQAVPPANYIVAHFLRLREGYFAGSDHGGTMPFTRA
jgi:hypothetical protein